MGLKDDLNAKVKEIFRSQWTTRDGTVVPGPKDIGLGNDAVKLEATVLYADLSDSTDLVDKQSWSFAAEVYKTFLHCAAKVVSAESGEITAYDGDRIMAVFLGSYRNTNAARCALKINHAVKHIINPALADQYSSNSYRVRHVVGIDASDLFVARTGIRGEGNNDLVWVGPAANYAAKLSALNEPGYTSFITERVYDKLNDEAKTSNGRPMWEARQWTARNMRVYRSGWDWVI